MLKCRNTWAGTKKKCTGRTKTAVLALAMDPPHKETPRVPWLRQHGRGSWLSLYLVLAWLCSNWPVSHTPAWHTVFSRVRSTNTKMTKKVFYILYFSLHEVQKLVNSLPIPPFPSAHNLPHSVGGMAFSRLMRLVAEVDSEYNATCFRARNFERK